MLIPMLWTLKGGESWMLWISITHSTTFVLAHPTFMSWGTTIVCASSFGASPLGPIRCSFKFGLFALY